MYIEFVIADNFLLTYLAGSSATRLCRNKVNVWRLIAAATVGTGIAVLYPFLRGGIFAELAVKISLYLVLCVIMFYKTNRAFVASLMFLGSTFAFGGASYALGLILYSSAARADAFTRKCPLFLVLGTGGAVYVCIRYCIKRMRLPRARAPYEYSTDVEIFGMHIKFAAFLDTGNCVFDSRTGLPVVITDVESFAAKLDGAAAIEFAKSLPTIRKIAAKTHGGSTEVYILKPTKITVYSDRLGHKINAMIGLVGGQSKRFSAEHEMLLNPAALSEGV
ncbi:MAG: sigma-E processing peptidase SpoIIGA [Clostridiales bacterium]|nr:sigma-E processing peptidase SpoIIGA [Clostridiales bacterium]